MRTLHISEVLKKRKSWDIYQSYKFLSKIKWNELKKIEQEELKDFLSHIARITKIYLCSINGDRIFRAKQMYEYFKIFIKNKLDNELEDFLRKIGLTNEWANAVDFYQLFMPYKALGDNGNTNIYWENIYPKLPTRHANSRWKKWLNIYDDIKMQINLAFIQAVVSNNVTLAKLLLDKEADINFTYKKYNFKSAFEIAKNANYRNMSKMLENFLDNSDVGKSETENILTPKFETIETNSLKTVLSAKEDPSVLYGGVHGAVYCLKLILLILKKELEKQTMFELVTESKEVDFIHIKNPNEEEKSEYTYMEVKLYYNGKAKITYNSLNTINGKLSLRKLFTSYQAIFDKDPTKRHKSFVLFTNSVLDENVTKYFKLVDTEIKNMFPETFYRTISFFQFNYANKDNPYYSTILETTETFKLIKSLVEYTMINKTMTLKKRVFKEFHASLINDNIIDIDNNKFHEDFIQGTNVELQNFRKYFIMEVINTAEKEMDEKTTWECVASIKINFSQSFRNQSREKNVRRISDAFKCAEKKVENFLKKFVLVVNLPIENELDRIVTKELGEVFQLLDVDFITNNNIKKIMDWMKKKQGKNNSDDIIYNEIEKQISKIKKNPYLEFPPMFKINPELYDSYNTFRNFLSKGIKSVFYFLTETLSWKILFKIKQIMYPHEKEEKLAFIPLSFLLYTLCWDVTPAKDTFFIIEDDSENCAEKYINECINKIDTFGYKLAIVLKKKSKLANSVTNNVKEENSLEMDEIEIKNWPFEEEVKVINKFVSYNEDSEKEIEIEAIGCHSLEKSEKGGAIENRIKRFAGYNQKYYINRTLLQHSGYNKKEISDEDLFHSNKKIVIINGSNGMGKTTLISRYIDKSCSNDEGLWIVKIDLAVCTSLLHELPDENFNETLSFETDDDNFELEDFLIRLMQISNISEVGMTEKEIFFQNLLFKHYSNEGKLCVVVDGFDKILPKLKKNVLKFLVNIKEERSNRLWITTSPECKALLEDTLETNSYSLIPFKGIYQKSFLIKFWGDAEYKMDNTMMKLPKKKRVKKILKLFSHLLQNGSPLCILIAAEYLKNNELDYYSENNIVTLQYLFDFFIINHIKTYTLSRGMDQTFRDQFKIHKITAIHQLCVNSPDTLKKIMESLNINYEKTMEEIAEIEKDTGIFEIINNQIRFTHSIYAEYLGACFLVDNTSSNSISYIFEIINDILVFTSHAFGYFVLALLKRAILTREVHLNFESIFHYAAQNNYQNIVKACIQERYNCQDLDKFGKTPLHYAAENGHENIVSLLLRTCEIMNDDAEKLARKNSVVSMEISNLIKITDNNNHTALHYPFKNGKWDVVNELIFSSKNFHLPFSWLQNAPSYVRNLAMSIMFSYNSKQLVELLNTDIEKEVFETLYFDYSYTVKPNQDLKFSDIDDLLKILPSPHYSLLDLVNRSDYYTDKERLSVTLFLLEMETKASWLYEIEDLDVIFPYVTCILQAAVAHGHIETYKHFLSNYQLEINYGLHFKIACCFSQRIIINYLINNHYQSLSLENDPVLKLLVEFFERNNVIIDALIIYFQKKKIINAKNFEGKTIFQFALESGYNFETIKGIIEYDVIVHPSDINLNTNNSEVIKYLERFLKKPAKNTFPLHEALKNNDITLAKFFIKNKYDVNKEDENRCAPLHHAVHDEKIIRFLFKRGAIYNASNAKCKIPLDLAKPFTDAFDLFKEVEKTFSLKLKMYNDDNLIPIFCAKNRMEKTLLHVVLEEGSDKIIKNILEIYFAKCKKYLHTIINSIDCNGNTPLHIAAVNLKNYEIFKQILKHGAFYDLENNKNDNQCVSYKQLSDNDQIKLLYQLIEETRDSCKLDKIKAKTLSVNDYFNYQDKNGKTILHYAVEKKDLEFVKTMLKNGANTEITDKDNQTPILTAYNNEAVDIFLFLLKSGAAFNIGLKLKLGTKCLPVFMKIHELFRLIQNNKNDDIELFQSFVNKVKVEIKVKNVLMTNICDKDGNTLLHTAAKNNCPNIVKFLISKGVPLNVLNKYGNTAEDLTSNQEIKDLLCFINELFFAANSEKTSFLQSKADEFIKRRNVMEIITKAKQRVYQNNRYNVINLLHVAAKKKNWEMINWLIKIGANNYEKDFFGSRAFRHGYIHAYIKYYLPLPYLTLIGNEKDKKLDYDQKEMNFYINQMQKEFYMTFTLKDVMHNIAREIVYSDIWKIIPKNPVGKYKLFEFGCVVRVAKYILGSDAKRAINTFFGKKDNCLAYFNLAFEFVRNCVEDPEHGHVPKFRSFFDATVHFFKYYNEILDSRFCTIHNIHLPPMPEDIINEGDKVKKCIKLFLYNVVKELFSERIRCGFGNDAKFTIDDICVVTKNETTMVNNISTEYIATFYKV